MISVRHAIASAALLTAASGVLGAHLATPDAADPATTHVRVGTAAAGDYEVTLESGEERSRGAVGVAGGVQVVPAATAVEYAVMLAT